MSYWKIVYPASRWPGPGDPPKTFTSQTDADKYRTEVLHDPKGDVYPLIETDEYGRF